ncbi:MAG: glycosyltransferase [Gemmatimonadota bacterium]|nr:glycosyltransferase [Gemmatimonadota bacterium]
MNRPAVLVVAAFDDAHHVHALHRVRALERLGCRVEEFDLLWRPVLLQRFTAGEIHERLERTIAETAPTLVVVIGGAEYLEIDRVDQLRARGAAKWVNWFPDDLRTVLRTADHARAYDQVLASSSDVAGALTGALGRPVELLPLAADPSVYRPTPGEGQYRANVVFSGRATGRREELLSELVEFGLAIWGPGWRRTRLRDYCRGEVPSTADFVRAYGGATVAINIHHHTPDAAQPEAHCNQRVFELAAMAVPQVVDQRRDLERWFTPGQDLLTFRTAAELREVVKALLDDGPRREAMASSARAELMARHTYMHRMSDLLRKTGNGE